MTPPRVPPGSPQEEAENGSDSEAEQVTLIMPGHIGKVRRYSHAGNFAPVHAEERRPPVNYESASALAQVVTMWQQGASGVSVREELQRSAGRFEPKPLTEVLNYLNRKHKAL